VSKECEKIGLVGRAGRTRLPRAAEAPAEQMDGGARAFTRCNIPRTCTRPRSPTHMGHPGTSLGRLKRRQGRHGRRQGGPQVSRSQPSSSAQPASALHAPGVLSKDRHLPSLACPSHASGCPIRALRPMVGCMVGWKRSACTRGRKTQEAGELASTKEKHRRGEHQKK